MKKLKTLACKHVKNVHVVEFQRKQIVSSQHPVTVSSQDRLYGADQPSLRLSYSKLLLHWGS